MITFHFEEIPEFKLAKGIKSWLESIIIEEGKKPGEISYILCDDDYLLKVNQDFLKHDYYTDIITFDYVRGKIISGDIFVSLQRIEDNAAQQNADFHKEFHRVLAHGILHLCGYKDKSDDEQILMRQKEDFYLSQLDF